MCFCYLSNRHAETIDTQKEDKTSLAFLQSHLSLSLSPGVGGLERFRQFGLLCLAPMVIILLKGMLTDYSSVALTKVDHSQSEVYMANTGGQDYASLSSIGLEVVQGVESKTQLFKEPFFFFPYDTNSFRSV